MSKFETLAVKVLREYLSKGYIKHDNGAGSWAFTYTNTMPNSVEERMRQVSNRKYFTDRNTQWAEWQAFRDIAKDFAKGKYDTKLHKALK